MAINIRKFELESEFVSAYNGDEYIEPWVSLCTETSGVAYDKVYLKEIEIKNLKMVGNVPASGATVNKDNCTYVVNAVYSNYSREDITAQAEVTGSLVVEASQIEQSHLAGVLTLTATYLGKEASASVKVYQEAFVPSITAITIDNLTWNVDIPSTGGTASKDNCTYTITAHWNIKGMTEDVTELATVTGSLVVPEGYETERHTAGTLTLVAEYSGITGSADIAIYQEACPNYLKFNILSGGNIAFGNMLFQGTATPLTIEYKKNDGEWTSLTSTAPDESTNPKTHEDVVNAFSSKFSVDAGDVVTFRGDNQAYAFIGDGNFNFNAFFSTASFNAEGNIMSLIDKNNFESLKELTTPGTFALLFSGCHGLISAENLLLPATALTDGCYFGMFYDYIGEAMGFDYVMSLTTAPSVLPATTLTSNCYSQMFQGCTSLTTAPELPATTLAGDCYNGMFNGCTNLTQAPELPATTLTSNCYGYMFRGCTSLTTAPTLPATTLASYCYGYMFAGCTSLTQAPELPATTLTSNCYEGMFLGCTSLITAPSVLPATTLADNCYNQMFQRCTSLTQAPALPARTLADSCYYQMFDSCTSLAQAPELPATTLANSCYRGMFSGCTSLTTASSVLPARTLTDYCYYGMFAGCTSLTTAPELPATTLTGYCYMNMFSGCSSLNYIKCLATNISASNCTHDWVSSVAASGTFVKNASMPSWTTGTNGIPSNWKIKDSSYIPYTADTSTVAESGEVRTIAIDTTDLITSSIAISIEGASDVTYTYDNGVITVTFPESESTARDIAVSINAETVDGEILKTKIMFNQGITLRSTPLTFNIISGGMITWEAHSSSSKKTIQYSKNGGEWTDITSNTGSLVPSIPVDAGDIVKFRGNNYSYCSAPYSNNSFSSSTPDLRFNAYGNIMSLIDSSDFKSLETLTFTLASSSAFTGLFSGCTSLVEADELLLPATALTSSCYATMFLGCTSLITAPSVLPATTLRDYCYIYMFDGCTSLTQAPALPARTLADSCYYQMFDSCTSLAQAPELPATTLANSCYRYMFLGCTSLTKAPSILPATTLADNCYSQMFQGCTSLTTAPSKIGNSATTMARYCCQNMFSGCTSLSQAPELPATALATSCYDSMFQGCTSLTTAPGLPATTLADGCYIHMFDGCTSLTTAPGLPATTLAVNCYRYMFNGCSSLNYIKCLATDTSARYCTGNWVNGVATEGTFVKNASKTWGTGVSGIPSGWTVQDAS